jgi:hypothetical protein
MNHRMVVALLLLGFSSTVDAASESAAAVALRLEAFKTGFRNCSRPTPQGITAFWQVDQPDVERIDAALILHLEKTGLAKKLRAPLSTYGRQYLGYSRGDHRFVYVNAFPRSSRDARSAYQRWCDGRNLFWGIEYDMKKRVFIDFEIDRPVGDPVENPLEGLKL